MVEYALNLDNIFASLADGTRRDILSRITLGEMTVGEIAKPYNMSLAAVSKHLKVLERACLIIKQRKGKEQVVSLSPLALKEAGDYIKFYTSFWENNLEMLDKYLTEGQE